MEVGDRRERKRVADLVHGDVTVEHGEVVHREGRKVWFENQVVTFGSVDDELHIAVAAYDRD